VGGRSRGRYATPADFDLGNFLHEGSPYRALHVRRGVWDLSIVQGAILRRAVPSLSVTIRNFVTAVRPAEAEIKSERERGATCRC
jgi:hypothetical protein